MNGNGYTGMQLVRPDGLTLQDVTASGNGHSIPPSTYAGSGIHLIPGSSTPVTIANSTISDNRATRPGGGIFIDSDFAAQSFVADITIAGSVVSGNTTDR